MILGAGLLVLAGVHVDGHEGFGFVDDEVAAALEIHLAAKSSLKLAGDVVAVEQRLRLVVEVHLAHGTGADALNAVADGFELLEVVDNDLVDVFGEEVADSAFDEVGLLINAGGHRLALDPFLDELPFLQQQGEITDEVRLALFFTGRANDHSHALRNG